ncbi:putative signal-transducing histidine kinase / response regulator [Candidatus Halobonum tyrrellensis G22]|uniref:histidine kinase n=1 Tax=Candidatus Halobonum tyrrellensis G22 TaxID=1324957 RepID=V4GS47_9EURY|nr:putative signal-transducing histidine kinase / response regulator [Candidatus Halobonum tyrrellensis G22]
MLHVDDDPAFADLTATYLERADDRFAVETATSADDGLDRLVGGEFDCVVSDHDMPGRNGLELLRSVRAEYPNLPFILFTGKGSEEVASEAISAGVTDYLQKEPGTEQYAILANRVRNAVERTVAQRERERHLNAIETAHEGIGILDEDERFVYVNQAYAELYGYDSETLVGEHWGRLYDDETARTIDEEVRPTLDASGRWQGEKTGVRADGTTFVAEHTITTTDHGEFVCLVRDLTERKRRERRFEAVFNNMYSFVGLLDPDGTVVEANETALAFGGLSREDVAGTPLWETGWFAPNEGSRTNVRAAVERAASGEQYRDQLRVRGADGDAVVDLLVRPVTDEAGEVTLLLWEGRDVTERRRRTRELETLVDNLPGVVYRGTADGGWPMEEVGGRVEHLTGYSASELGSQGGPCGDELVHEDDREEWRETTRAAAERQESFELTYRIVTKEGTTKWVWERGQGVSAVEGGAEHLEGFITDITARREVTEELQRERAFVEQALDTLDELFYVVGEDGDLQRWNRRFADVTGYTDEELSGMDAAEFFPDDERERIADAIDRTLTTGKVIVEADLLTKEGDRKPYEFSGSRLRHSERDVVGLVGVGRELGGRKRHERTHERRNGRLDEFARTVSHDLASPLNVAQGRIELAREECDSEHLSEAAGAVSRAQELVEDAATLAQEDDRSGDVEAVDLSPTVRDCWRNTETAEATLVVDTELTIRAVRSRLQQLLENLIRNAVEHGGDTVVVRVGGTDGGFYVADDGPGIPEGERDEVFEPGYSTGEDGSGFGLWIVSRVADDHGWEVEVTASEEGGTRHDITGVDIVE